MNLPDCNLTGIDKICSLSEDKWAWGLEKSSGAQRLAQSPQKIFSGDESMEPPSSIPTLSVACNPQNARARYIQEQPAWYVLFQALLRLSASAFGIRSC